MKIDTMNMLKLGIGILLVYLAATHWDSLSAGIATILGAGLPLMVGGIIAYVLNILMSWFEKRWFPNSKKKFIIASRRVICLIFAILSLIAIVALIVLLVLPQLWDAIALLVSEAPKYINLIIEWVESLEILPEDIFKMFEGIDWKSQLTTIISKVASGVGGVVGMAVNVVAAIFTSVFNSLLAIIFAIYLLFAKEKLASQIKRIMARYFKREHNETVLHVIDITNDCFHNYIVGQCTEAIILGALCTIGMLIFNFPYATMVGALIAFTALIPIAGAYIGAGVGAFMILTVDPLKAVLFLVYIIVLQQLEGNIIYPRVVGSSIGLPGIWVLAAITLGGGVMGILGMLLGVPLAAVAYRLLREDVERGKKNETDTEKVSV